MISDTTMQIFVLNIQCKTITLDMEPEDIIKTVKEKLEAKIGIPSRLQKLVFNGNHLLDEKSLLFYNILKESYLHLNFQTLRHSRGQVVQGPSVDWINLANYAKSKVDEDIVEREALYENLMTKKMGVVGKVKKIEAELKQHEAADLEASKKILEKEEEIKTRENNLKKAQELLAVSKRDRCFMIGRRDIASLKRITKQEELGTLQMNIAKLDEELEETFTDSCDHLSKINEGLLENKMSLLQFPDVQFLSEIIAEKESCLECPVCYQTSSPPIYKCTKEHLICSKCFPVVNNKCPTCRSGFDRNDKIFRLAEENWRELQKLKAEVEEM